MRAQNFARLMEIWREARRNEIGIVVKTSNPGRLKSDLYSARAEDATGEYSDMTIRTSPTNPEGEVWLVNNVPAPHSVPPPLWAARQDPDPTHE